jgi:hypothetical protein
MMQGALDRVATARGHMQRHEVAEKGQEIRHCRQSRCAIPVHVEAACRVQSQ